MKIFLDDERFPPSNSWCLARSVDDLQAFIDMDIPITEISLDHDLGEDLPTGHDAVKLLVEVSMEHPSTFLSLKKVTLHSANVIGLENMEGFLRSAIRAKVFPDIPIERRSALDFKYDI